MFLISNYNFLFGIKFISQSHMIIIIMMIYFTACKSTTFDTFSQLYYNLQINALV